MAVPAFSTLLDWQLEETKISNINSGAQGVEISSTYFYSHFLPSDKLVWLPTFFFCKNGSREEQARKIISIIK